MRIVCWQTNYRLMQVKNIAECSILQYFLPSLSYHSSLRSLFCLFLSGPFTQVLLYVLPVPTLTWRPGISYKGLSYLFGLCDYKLSNEEMMFSRLQMIHKTYDPSREDIIIFK